MRWFEGIWAMLKMKLDDNGENLEENVLSLRPWHQGFFNKMFTIIYTFSGRGFDLANFSKHASFT
jgi:hypothetical protein